MMWADSATPYPIKMRQPDGSTVLIRRHGDEWGHWSTDDKGRVVEKGADGFYRPVEGMTLGESVTVHIRWTEGWHEVLSREYAWTVRKEENGKVWLGDADGCGVIIRK